MDHQEKMKLPSSVKKHIRKEKARIRREFFSNDDIRTQIDKLYDRFEYFVPKPKKPEVEKTKEQKSKKTIKKVSKKAPSKTKKIKTTVAKKDNKTVKINPKTKKIAK